MPEQKMLKYILSFLSNQNKSSTFITLMIALFLFFPVTLVHGQSRHVKSPETNYSIKGRVVEPRECKPIQDCSVTIPETNLGARTDTLGNYEIHILQPGSYTVRFFCVGYEERYRKTVIDDKRKQKIINVALEEGAPFIYDDTFDLDTTIRTIAIADAESDLVKGHIFLITPDSITGNEKIFAQKYGLEFKQKEKPLPYYYNYNETVHKYLVKKYGEQFHNPIDSLWRRTLSYFTRVYKERRQKSNK